MEHIENSVAVEQEINEVRTEVKEELKIIEDQQSVNKVDSPKRIEKNSYQSA